MRRCAVLAVFVCLSGLNPVSGQVPTQSQAPELRLRDIRGRIIRLSDYHGNVVLVNFWATWCPPCRAEMTDLVRLQRDYRSHGLRVIGITYPPQTISEVRRFTRRMRVNYPIALGTKETKTLFTTSDTLPMTFVIGEDGRVQDVIEGILLPEEFEQRIKPLLRRVTGSNSSVSQTCQMSKNSSRR